MAGAPSKDNLDYFPFDVGTINDRKFRKAKMKFGSLSIVIYIALLDLVYGDKGYYLDYSEDSKDGVLWEILNTLQGAYQPKVETIEEVIELLVACELFSGDQFNNKILTSKRIQQTFYKVTVERKMVNVNFDYWILSENEMKSMSSRSVILQQFVNRSSNSINQSINTKSQPINDTKESKVKESKVKESKALTTSEYDILVRKHGKMLTDQYITKTTRYKCCNYSTIEKWIAEDAGKAKKNQFNDINQRDYDMDKLEQQLLNTNNKAFD